jgi:outer membrane cobalamin receptor
VVASYVGRRPDTDFSQFPSPTITLPSYVRLDLSGEQRLARLFPGGRSLSVTARLENALDKKYQDVLGFAAPGRTVLLGGVLTAR